VAHGLSRKDLDRELPMLPHNITANCTWDCTLDRANGQSCMHQARVTCDIVAIG
jgi:hypothetical protein